MLLSSINNLKVTNTEKIEASLHVNQKAILHSVVNKSFYLKVKILLKKLLVVSWRKTPNNFKRIKWVLPIRFKIYLKSLMNR